MSIFKRRKTKVTVFVTKNFKFRAKIDEPKMPTYEVTVGGKSWVEGKGKEHSQIIFDKIQAIMQLLYEERTALIEGSYLS